MTENELEKYFENVSFKLIKFIDEKYLETTLDGNLFMNNAKYFCDDGEINGDGRGDKYDSKIPLKGGKLILSDFETKEPIYVNENADITLELENVSYPIYCLYSLDYRNMCNIKMIGNKVNYSLSINESDREKIIDADFGNKALIIKDPIEFKRRVTNACNNKNLNVSFDKIKYMDLNIMTKKRLYTPPSFIKGENFEYQHEYRVVVGTDVNEPLILSIGSIRDISSVMDTNDFLKSEFICKVDVENKIFNSKLKR